MPSSSYYTIVDAERAQRAHPSECIRCALSIEDSNGADGQPVERYCRSKLIPAANKTFAQMDGKRHRIAILNFNFRIFCYYSIQFYESSLCVYVFNSHPGSHFAFYFFWANVCVIESRLPIGEADGPPLLNLSIGIVFDLGCQCNAGA